MTHTCAHTHSFVQPLSHPSVTHQIDALCDSTHKHSDISVCVCVFAWDRRCVYHLEECTVFGDVKSSPQW